MVTKMSLKYVTLTIAYLVKDLYEIIGKSTTTI